MITIEDEIHAESQGSFLTIKDAILELEKRSKIPWNETPNQAPCTSWETCGRYYEIIEYDDTSTPWKELRRIPALEISSNDITWYIKLDEEGNLLLDL